MTTTEEFIQKSGGVLKECEKAMQQLLTEAVAAGDYGAVTRLTSLAVAIRRLASEVGAPSLLRAWRDALPADSATHGTGRRNVGRNRSSDYPRFLRRGEDLIKIGWSKKERKEYQHKMTRKAVEIFVATLAGVGKGRKVFATDKLLSAIRSNDELSAPEYQVYVLLAWLRHIGLVEQHGRQGYSVPRADSLHEETIAAWDQLPEG